MNELGINNFKTYFFADLKYRWVKHGSTIFISASKSPISKISFILNQDLYERVPIIYGSILCKVRDVTFVNQEGVMHMLCMSSAGHIYWQPMSEESRASLGTFYVTNTLEVLHPEIQVRHAACAIAEIYYLLFFFVLSIT